MAELDDLIARQQQAMGTITRALANFKKLGQAKMSLAATRSRLNALREAFHDCQELDAQLLIRCPSKDRNTIPYFTGDDFAVCEAAYYEASDFMHEIIAAHEAEASRKSSVNPELPTRTSSQLPQLRLPTFDGDYKQWESFQARFNSLVIRDRSLLEVDKLHYLLSCLTGEASNVLSHFALTDANFKLAWQALTDRYDNKRLLVTSHLDELFSLPTVTAVDPLRAIRNLRDRTQAAVLALGNLGRPIHHWDDILIYLVTRRLDSATRQSWELLLGDTTDHPTYPQLLAFLSSRIRALEAMINRLQPENRASNARAQPKLGKLKPISSHAATIASSCPICKADHLIYQCDSFRNKSPNERYNLIKGLKRCINCFSTKHNVQECSSDRSCKICRRRHHTMLHFPANAPASPARDPTLEVNPSIPSDNCVTDNVNVHALSCTPNNVLLATARVRIFSPRGHFTYARALLDQGSAATVITERVVQLLNLPRSRTSLRVIGVGDSETTVRYTTDISISPHFESQPSYSTVALILKSVTQYLPRSRQPFTLATHLQNLRLADGAPMSSDPIDLIIGADLYGILIREGVRRGQPNEPVAQNTALGWIVSGPFHSSPNSRTGTPSSTSIHHISVLEHLDSTLRQFWEVESIPSPHPVAPEDQRCESHFLSTHSRTSSGRYQVRLPFKVDPPPLLGNSRPAAEARLFQLERRLLRQPAKLDLYRAFMSEYLKLNHMEIAPNDEANNKSSYYIPHHAVLKDSQTTPLRVVFNASCRTSTGKSLNDHLHIGPKLQGDLLSILLRWRQFRYAYTTDITKMYRQILMDKRDRDYQRILWRDSLDEPVKCYRLCTVTYGTSSAAYQAQRVLHQLVLDEGSAFPLAAPILLNQTYVDDILFGADDVPLAVATRHQITSLLQKGGFQSRKWGSNSPHLLTNLDPTDHGLAFNKQPNGSDSLSILGMNWHPSSDVFKIRVALPATCGHSKRAILSVIARLFDPLGFLTPVTITAKIILQRVWLAQCDWDETVPSSILQSWSEYFASLSNLNEISVPRWIHLSHDSIQFSLHGFSDASRDAYAAAVYGRVVSIDGSVSVHLLAAKSRVSPLKTLSIPRLELSGALLLARLVQTVRASLPRLDDRIHCWSDSTIVLSWLRQEPAQWQTFVANRVSNIQRALPLAIWRYVPTRENPADYASRGINAEEFLNRQLWWGGPSWLRLHPDLWPVQPPLLSATGLPERRGDVAIHVATTSNRCYWLDKFSSWPKLLRVTAYLFKFLLVTRERKTQTITAPHPSASRGCPLTPDHIRSSKCFLLRQIQESLFSVTIQCLRAKRPLPRSDPLLPLNPFLDNNGLLRVGGRLSKSGLPVRTRHPIIIASHPVVRLIILHYHKRTLHGGHSLTLSSLREDFWLQRARSTVRNVLRNCVVCCREAAAAPTELMGELPAIRVTPQARAFVHTGVDYAGPILVKSSSGRGFKTHKAYVALFICMTTKAIHLELVHDYGSDAFLAAFQRFSARRGTPSSMYSDNATNFQGADHALARAHQLAIRDPNFITALATDGIKWHFLPPSAPHFGGLWEAGVRRLKHHLRRCMGDHKLTSEEMGTLLCRVESCLNSRPLAPLTDSVTELDALTPGHFLIGAPLLSPPEPSLLHFPEGRLSRWQLVQRISEQCWFRWRQEYLHTLQQRPKWRTVQNLARVGRLVLLRDNNAPPCRWDLGRITKCHPGTDNLVRVVTVKTARSSFRRPITKIVFLPIDINDAERQDSPTLS